MKHGNSVGRGAEKDPSGKDSSGEGGATGLCEL